MDDVALLDWDRSLRLDWTIRPWTEHLEDEGILPPKLVSSFHAHLWALYSEQRINHDELALRANGVFAWALHGTNADLVSQQVPIFVRHDVQKLLPFTRGLITELRRRSIEPIIVSGAPEDIIRAHTRAMGVVRVYGLTLLTDEDHLFTGRFTGAGNVADKVDTVNRLSQTSRVRVALGDSNSDEPLLSAATDLRVVVENGDLAARLGAVNISRDTTAAQILSVLSDHLD